jgi:hypothetical protein
MIHLKNSLTAPLRTADVKVDAVCTALQQAIELEHSTIPLYLYALYSIDSSRNPAVADIIQSVAIEEMLHMTLASNILNALGGSPKINGPTFIPTYPGHLPGAVEQHLVVNLAPFSMTQLECFLEIEEPENPLVFPVKPALAAVPPESDTIGQFYAAISLAIASLGDGAFVNPPRNQVGPDLMDGSVIVTNVQTAQMAISTIVEQGEGTTNSPMEVAGGEVAHYYRFMEIKNGKMLVPDASEPGGYSYSGAPVPFDPAGVYQLPVNPGVPPGYKPGSVQAFANNNFNYTYTSLLNSLHILFNGDTSPQRMNEAIGLMMSLKGQAKAMMAGIPDNKVLTGPTFQYLPVLPS